ncbi:UTRA domain-containing protein [Nonomuraea roseoviolacea subsp. roseoviolacea]|uniref:GntR family transcriptional regulator n=1 Tax=Nonomuraea roseoviolacea TaxID=103837 RepID=UPI0031CDEA19
MAEAEYLYERIASELRDRMESGSLNPGDRLPSQDAIAQEFSVSRIVARRALDILESEGLIDRTQRLGAFVRRRQPLIRRSALHYVSAPGAPFAEEALQAERIPRFAHASARTPAEPEIAQRLKIPTGAEVMRTSYLSYGNQHPVMSVVSYEPLAITGGTVIEFPEGPGPYPGAGLVDRFTAIGKRPTVVVERLRCRMPRPSEIDLLSLRPGTPVIVMTRTTYLEDLPLETADMLFDADRYELEYPIVVSPRAQSVEDSSADSQR